MEVEYILCVKCKDTGLLESDGIKSICPVCDGDPKITYETVAEYARQIDKLREEVYRLTSMLSKIKNILG
jgi:uncharacterized Zn finger protein (UPF0148 family)